MELGNRLTQHNTDAPRVITFGANARRYGVGPTLEHSKDGAFPRSLLRGGRRAGKHRKPLVWEKGKPAVTAL